VVARVFVHLGLPKTATSYLQTILWSNRDELRRRGVVVPGVERRDHLWSSRTVREDPAQDRAPSHHREAWTRVRDELAGETGTGLISHEFFAAASRAQARAMVAALAPAEVHVVVTAREPLGLFTASWQESIKNGATTAMADYGRHVSRSSTAIWNWRSLDLRLVLERWTTAVPPERCHVVVLDPAAPREDVWHRFGAVLGLDTHDLDLSHSFPNTSMGVAEAETLRRLNGRLDDFSSALDRGVYLRSYLADDRLVPRGGERYWPEDDQVEECRRRGRDAVAYLSGAPFDVVGDLVHLEVPAVLEERRRPASVTDAEVADVALDLAATLLTDVRALRRARRAAAGGAGGRRLTDRLPDRVRDRLRRWVRPG
jgi:hypothetical protein